MSDTVNVPRKLLNRLLAAQFEGDEEVGTVVSEFVALLAAEPPAVEEVEVVAVAYSHRSRDSVRVTTINVRQIGQLRDGDQLMTVAQHRQIISRLK